ncbi:MAG: DUF4861 family protein [Bacteroidota bacterium]
MRISLLTLIALMLWSCTSRNHSFSLNNPLPVSRTDAGITLPRETVAGWMRIPENKIPYVSSRTDQKLVSQANDLNGDGKWDELFILADYDSLEAREVSLRFISPSAVPEVPVRTNIRLGDRKNNNTEISKAMRLNHAINTKTAELFQMEGPAWENDHVGFRNYLDLRNGMDIFGKTTAEMVLDSVGIEGFPGYHELSWWGMDILKVDKSLGAGSLAFDLNDSIYRLGDNGRSTFENVYEGPVRSALRFDFTGWKMGSDSLDASQLITIEAGKYCYESTVTVKNCEKPVLLVTGIVNKKSHELHTVLLNSDFTAFYTLDHQAEDSTLLGMALMVSNSDLVNFGETPGTGEGITETYFVRLKITNTNPVSFRFYSFWERENPEWSDPSMIERELKNEAALLSAPIRLSDEE